MICVVKKLRKWNTKCHFRALCFSFLLPWSYDFSSFVIYFVVLALLFALSIAFSCTWNKKFAYNNKEWKAATTIINSELVAWIPCLVFHLMTELIIYRHYLLPWLNFFRKLHIYRVYNKHSLKFLTHQCIC